MWGGNKSTLATNRFAERANANGNSVLHTKCLTHSAAHFSQHAGAVRFRPIVLTSITTFVGLAPIILDNTISLSMFVPMAISLAFGVLVGTSITLFLVPCMYMILEDILIATGARKSAVYEDGIQTGSEYQNL